MLLFALFCIEILLFFLNFFIIVSLKFIKPVLLTGVVVIIAEQKPQILFLLAMSLMLTQNSLAIPALRVEPAVTQLGKIVIITNA